MAVHGNRRPVGFVVRRPVMLWGVQREIGEYLPMEEVQSIVRLESMVRAGRFNAVYEEDGYRVERRRDGNRVLSRTPIEPETPPFDDYPEDGTIPEVKAWIGDDIDKARHAQEMETARDTPRVTLLEWLAGILEEESADV